MLPIMATNIYLNNEKYRIHSCVMLQVEVEFLNNYICKLNERKFQNEFKKTLDIRTKSHDSQRTA